MTESEAAADRAEEEESARRKGAVRQAAVQKSNDEAEQLLLTQAYNAQARRQGEATDLVIAQEAFNASQVCTVCPQLLFALNCSLSTVSALNCVRPQLTMASNTSLRRSGPPTRRSGAPPACS